MEKVAGIEDCPAAVATTFTGKSSRGIREIRDLLFRHDPQVRVEESGFRDVILVYTRLSREVLRDIITRYRPSAVARFVVSDLCLVLERPEQIDLLVDSIAELFRRFQGSRFYVECVRRGRFIESCHQLEALVGKRIHELGLGRVDFESPEYVVKIENIRNMFIVSVMRPGQDRLRRSLE